MGGMLSNARSLGQAGICLTVMLLALAQAAAAQAAADRVGSDVPCSTNVANVPKWFDIFNGDQFLRTVAAEDRVGGEPAVLLDGARQYEAKALAAVGTCPAGPQRDLIRAYIAAWRAELEWFDKDDSWRDDLNLSDSLFRACMARNAGTTLGAHCETVMQQNARRRALWAPAAE
jgi:hypothetical protein